MFFFGYGDFRVCRGVYELAIGGGGGGGGVSGFGGF